MSDPTFEDLVEAFLAPFGPGTADEQRFAVELYRRLADGAPVAEGVLAAELALPVDVVRARLNDLPSFYIGFDEDHRVIEWGGFGLDGGNNDFTIRGHRMWAWCAWDALFVPTIVGDAARVAADDPESGARVSLTVTPDGVAAVDPPGAVMTFALPGMAAFPDFATFSFQQTVFFFESQASADVWLDKHPGPRIVSLEEGFALGAHLNRMRFPDIEDHGAAVRAR